MSHRCCVNCRKLKEYSKFYPCRHNTFGISSRCIKCNSIVNQIYQLQYKLKKRKYRIPEQQIQHIELSTDLDLNSF